MWERIFLSPLAEFVENENAFLVYDEQRILRIAPKSDALLAALCALKDGCSRDDVVAHLSGHADPLLAELHSERLLVRSVESDAMGTLCERQLGYLASFSDDPATAQHQISGAKVAILGVGGIGSAVLQHLLGAGIHRFALIDSDYVELTNLNRQFVYTLDTLGQSKVDAAQMYARRITDSADIATFQRTVRTEEDLGFLDTYGPSLVVHAADRPPNVDDCVATYCFSRGMPMLTGRVGLERGYWGPLVIPGVTACYECTRRSLALRRTGMEELLLSAHLSGPTPYSFGPINSMIGAMMSRDIVRYLGGATDVASLGARLFLHVSTLVFHRHAVERCGCPCASGPDQFRRE